MRINSFDYFRGIAILFIVAGHSYGPWEINSIGEKTFANLVSGGTTLFVFISGFFFHHVFYNKVSYREFITKKSKNVLAPYATISILAIIYFISTSTKLPYSDELEANSASSWSDYMELVFVYLWTGRIINAYWYIPFIFIIFLLSPLLSHFIRLHTPTRIAIFLFLFAVSTLIHRPPGNDSIPHSILYFTPIYMLGIIVSINKEEVTNLIKGKSMIFGMAAVAMAFMQAILFEGHGNFHKQELFSYGGIDIMLIQKTLLCFFFLSFLQGHEHRKIPSLKLLASSSFALYFIHPWVLTIIRKTEFLSYFEFLPGFGVFVITIPMVVMSSLFIAYSFKRILKKNSRYITGW